MHITSLFLSSKHLPVWLFHLVITCEIFPPFFSNTKHYPSKTAGPTRRLSFSLLILDSTIFVSCLEIGKHWSSGLAACDHEFRFADLDLPICHGRSIRSSQLLRDLTIPPPPVRNRPHHRGLRPLLFSKISVVLQRFLLIDTEGWRRQGTAHDAIIELRKFRTYSQTSHHDIASIFKDSSWYYGPAGISTRFFPPGKPVLCRLS